MFCMICKQEVSETEIICPHCGAMPWQMPENFLNADQHHSWLENVYNPQLKRWESLQRIQEENRILRDENEALKRKINESDDSNKAIPDGSNYNHDTDVLQSSNIHLPNKLIKKKAFFSAISSCIELDNQDKEEIYGLLQGIYQSFQRYEHTIAEIPPTKHGESRQWIIRNAMEELMSSTGGASTKEESFTLLILDYLTYRFSNFDEDERQYLLHQIYKAIRDAAK